jgi:hypothetical protein
MICTLHKSRRMRWTRHITRTAEKKKAYRFLVRKPGGERPLGRPRRRCEDNVQIDLRQRGWNGVYRSLLVPATDKGRAVSKMVMNYRVP